MHTYAAAITNADMSPPISKSWICNWTHTTVHT